MECGHGPGGASVVAEPAQAAADEPAASVAAGDGLAVAIAAAVSPLLATKVDEAAVQAIVDEAVEAASVPRPVVLCIPDRPDVSTVGEHECFAMLVSKLQCRLLTMLSSAQHERRRSRFVPGQLKQKTKGLFSCLLNPKTRS